MKAAGSSETSATRARLQGIVKQNRNVQGVPRGNVNIPGGHSIGRSKQKSVYVHVSYSERFPR
jgi:hypothetical protein